MAPTKFENSIKDTLEKRSLKPSENSWEKLSQQLDSEKKKNNSRPYWLIGIAASILLLISAGLVFFEDRVESSIDPVMVESQDIKNVIEDSKVELTNEKLENQELIQDNSDDIIIAESNSTDNDNNIKNTPSKNEFVLNDKSGLVETSKNLKSDISKSAVVEIISKPKSENLLETTKIQKVVAEIIERNVEDLDVSKQEIDSLLKAAQRELFKQKINAESSIKVSAESLLRDVEEDMDRSFRDKVYDALKNSYESVKTAVVDRKKN